MLYNYLTTAYRHLRRHRTTTLMNVISLSIGIAGCLVVYVIVRHEYTYDHHQPQYERIHRLVTQTKTAEGTDYFGAVSLAMAEVLRDELTAVEAATQVYSQHTVVAKHTDADGDEYRFPVAHTVFVDTHFFDIFQYAVLAGSQSAMLQSPDEVVLTHSLADRIFGVDHPGGYEALIGETLNVDSRDLRISGVLADVSDRTNIYFQMLLPMEVYRRQRPKWSTRWEPLPGASNAFFTVAEGHQPDEVGRRINQLRSAYLNEDLAQRRTYHVQALSDVHTEARYGGTFFAVPSLLLGALGGLALVVLLVGSINFVNLSTAQAIHRAREVGIRKALGGHQRQLIGQFLGEAAVQIVIATLLAVGLAELFLEAVNQYMTPFSRWVVMRFSLDISVLPFLIVLAVVVSLLAGLYPAIAVTRFQPVRVLKQSAVSQLHTGFGARFSLRKLLTVAQFTIVQLLLVGTLVVANQMRYFQEQDAGYTQGNVVLINVPNPNKGTELRKHLLRQTGVNSVSLAHSPPTSRRRSWNEVYVPGRKTRHKLFVKGIDPHYLDTYGLSLTAGRNLRTSDFVADSVTNFAVLLNETAVRTLGFENPEAAVGQTITLDRDDEPSRMEVVGVLTDFVNNTLKNEVQAEYFCYRSDITTAHVRWVGHPTEALARIQSVWESYFTEGAFHYEFLDDYLATLYTLEDMLYRCFRLMTGLALVIGCLGLYGLASYLTLHRRKEIGIRKTLGATVRQILLRFTREFAGLVFIAFIVAAPLGYFAMRTWLNTFAHRIELHAGFFTLALLIALTIAGLTVGYRSLRAAVANPVDSLRDE